MVDVRFFGRVREALDCEHLQIEIRSGSDTIDDLVIRLGAERGPAWADTLREPNLISARNHEVVAGDVTLVDGDEVAFFPPVTGG